MEHPARRGSPAPLTYEEALARITGLGRFRVKLGLERPRELLRRLGEPATGLRGALIAGTNGKGSTAAFLAAILEAGGLRTGTTPSPHLESYTERVQVSGEPISEAEFAAALQAIIPALDAVADEMGEATEFETLLALALNWLAPRADRLVIEVGMGGRLDATNVLDLGVAVVTNVSLDHERWLGATVPQIAFEKAAIIKPGNVAVTGAAAPALAVVERRADEVGVPLWRLGQEIRFEARDLGWEGSELWVAGPGFRHEGLRIGLPGSFQPANAALAVAAAHALGDADPAALRSGLQSARWPGRLERFEGSPPVVLDGGHNPEAMARLTVDLRRLAPGRRIAVVFAAMRDKDLGAIFTRLRDLDPVYVALTRAASAGERGAEPADLGTAWGPGGEPVETAVAALAAARAAAGPDGLVLVTGSLYLVGELRPRL